MGPIDFDGAFKAMFVLGALAGVVGGVIVVKVIPWLWSYSPWEIVLK